MTAEQEADCIVIGKKGDAYYLTAATNGGGYVSLMMAENVYRQLILQIAEHELSESRQRVRNHLAHSQ